MLNARVLLLAGIASFVAVTLSAPAGKEMQWTHDDWVRTLDSCKRFEHVEQFNDGNDYQDAPTHGAFVKERYGIGFFNLARVIMNDHHPKHMIPAPTGDDSHAAAAIGATTRADGQALDGSMGFMAIRPGSKVHAFKVKKLRYFCVQNREPADCTMGFMYSPATFETSGTVAWQMVGRRGGQKSTYMSSWSSPPVAVVFENLPKLQAFSLGLPIAKLGSWDNSTLPTDKLNDELNKSGTTAYLESIEFTTWECNDKLPSSPLGGAMRRILTGDIANGLNFL